MFSDRTINNDLAVAASTATSTTVQEDRPEALWAAGTTLEGISSIPSSTSTKTSEDCWILPSDIAAALRFNGIREGEHFEVCAMQPKEAGAGIASHVFQHDAEGIAAAAVWASHYQGLWNLYVGTNP